MKLTFSPAPAKVKTSVLLAAIFGSAPANAAYCPSYSPATSSCGIYPAAGTNPSISSWNTLFADVARGPGAWGAGPTVGNIRQGCAAPAQVAPVVPCVILKAKVMQESSWYHFCKPTLPSSAVGAASRTLVTSDCGYGASQVTSGMHKGESPSFSRSRVAAEPRYNLQVGLAILGDKWDTVNCVGDRQPAVAEHWYSALWAYNGLSYINNPNNPNKRAGRGVYDPAVNSGSQSRWTYTERVFGIAEHPPDSRYWPALALAYPNRGDVGTGSSPRVLPMPNCSSPSSCAVTRSVHSGSCSAAPLVRNPGASDAGDDAGDASDEVDTPLTPEQETTDADDSPWDDDASSSTAPNAPKNTPPLNAATGNDGATGSSCLCRMSTNTHQKSWLLPLAALCILAKRRLRIARHSVTRR